MKTWEACWYTVGYLGSEVCLWYWIEGKEVRILNGISCDSSSEEDRKCCHCVIEWLQCSTEMKTRTLPSLPLHPLHAAIHFVTVLLNDCSVVLKWRRGLYLRFLCILCTLQFILHSRLLTTLCSFRASWLLMLCSIVGEVDLCHFMMW